MKILDYQKIVYPEACESIKGFHADVARYKAINVTGMKTWLFYKRFTLTYFIGFDENGNSLSFDMKGWNARIIQHEIDHLNGILYTDIMDKKTLTCSCWNVINERGGKVELPYGE